MEEYVLHYPYARQGPVSSITFGGYPIFFVIIESWVRKDNNTVFSLFVCMFKCYHDIEINNSADIELV